MGVLKDKILLNPVDSLFYVGILLEISWRNRFNSEAVLEIIRFNLDWSVNVQRPWGADEQLC